jgi:hypothetical protein
MPNRFQRFELLLPTKFNSGLPVPNDAFADTLLAGRTVRRFHRRADNRGLMGSRRTGFGEHLSGAMHNGSILRVRTDACSHRYWDLDREITRDS